MRTDLQILDTALNSQVCQDFVNDPAAGGVVIFVGTVRNQTDNKEVMKLEFEAFDSMAKKECKKLRSKLLLNGTRLPFLYITVSVRLKLAVLRWLSLYLLRTAKPHLRLASLLLIP